MILVLKTTPATLYDARRLVLYLIVTLPAVQQQQRVWVGWCRASFYSRLPAGHNKSAGFLTQFTVR